MTEEMYNDDRTNDDDRNDEQSEANVFADACYISLSIAGEKLDSEYLAKVAEVVLEQYVDAHHVARVVIQEVLDDKSDYDLGSANKYANYLGKNFSLKVEADLAEEPRPVTMTFNGIIGNIEFKNSIDGLYLITLVVYSPTLLMDGVPKNASYVEQSSSDIIGSILSNYKITRGQLDSTSGRKKYCVQYRETDYNFIMRLASGAGLFSFYNGQEFHVTKANSDKIIDLYFPSTLGWFTLEMGAKPYEYNTAVYNYAQQKNYVQDSKSIPQQASLSDNSQVAAKVSKNMFSDSKFVQQANVIEDAQSLDKVLSLKRSQAMGRLVVAKGQSGNPTVAIGSSIKISHMGHLNGNYWVTKVKHVYRAGAYYNIFECVPIDLAFPKSMSTRPAITNVQMAVVVDNNDPEELGRVKVKFPWLESEETPWVRYMTPHASAECGWYCLPEIDDEVLVGYEQGSPDTPVILGSLYNSGNKIPPEAFEQENNVKMFMTKSGNKIVFNDASGSEEVQIITKDGKNLITMKTGGPTVIESEGNIDIKAGGDIKMEGMNITIESQAELKIKAGTNTNVEAGVNGTVKAGAQLQLEGMTTAVKGTPIQLN